MSNNEIVNLYKEIKNIWKVGDIVGLSGQQVWAILKMSKVEIYGAGPKWNQDDDEALISLYASGIEKGDGKLDQFCLERKRTKQFVCRKANRLGLSDSKRKVSKQSDLKKNMSARMINWIKENGHPRGSLGMTHTEDSKKVISKKSKKFWNESSLDKTSEFILRGLKTRHAKGTLYRETGNVTWKAGWREIGGIKKYYRSRWEANYARYLDYLKAAKLIKSWSHEPETFWFEKILRGTRSYLPDFLVVENNDEKIYHEVKGWFDQRSKTKLKRMAKYHPKVKIVVIDTKAYKEIEKKLSSLISGWE